MAVQIIDVFQTEDDAARTAAFTELLTAWLNRTLALAQQTAKADAGCP